MKPIVAINCKTYPQATGRNAVKLARESEHFSKKASIIIVCPAIDVEDVAHATSLPVFVEHADPDLPGKSTGAIVLEEVKKAGAKGVMLNHVERPLAEKTIALTIKRCKALKLNVLLCADTPQQAKRLMKYAPDYLAVEPPELIGGKISVSEAKPEVIIKTVALLKGFKGKILVGAGIHSRKDVQTAMRLGTAGVLLASSIDLAKNKKKAIAALLE